MKMNHNDLPVIAEIVIPLRAKHFDDKDNKENDFQCGFANWKLADSMVNVGTDDNQIGHLGGTFGGHYEVDKYYPNHENYRQWYNVQLNTEDIWYAVEKVLDKLQSDPEEMAKLREKLAEYTKKMELLAQVQKMQKEAAEEAELQRLIDEEEAEIKKLEDNLKDE